MVDDGFRENLNRMGIQVEGPTLVSTIMEKCPYVHKLRKNKFEVKVESNKVSRFIGVDSMYAEI